MSHSARTPSPIPFIHSVTAICCASSTSVCTSVICCRTPISVRRSNSSPAMVRRIWASPIATASRRVNPPTASFSTAQPTKKLFVPARRALFRAQRQDRLHPETSRLHDHDGRVRRQLSGHARRSGTPRGCPPPRSPGRAGVVSLVARWVSSTDLMYVPIPPFHSKSTHRMARISSFDVNSPHRVGESERPASRSGDRTETGADLPVRSHTPPTTAGVSSLDLQSDQGCTFRFTHANAISDWAAVRIYRLAAPTTAQSRAALGLASTTQRFRLEACSACRSRRRPCAGSRSR